MCNIYREQPSATVGGHYLRCRAVIGARWGLPGRTWRVWRLPPTHGTLYHVSVYIFSLYLCICVKRLMCWGVGEWTSGGDTWRAGRLGYTRCSPPLHVRPPWFSKVFGGRELRYLLLTIHFEMFLNLWFMILKMDAHFGRWHGPVEQKTNNFDLER